MRIAIGSAWRSSESNVKRYFDQVFKLAGLLEQEDHELRVIAVEGDSIDGTLIALNRAATERLLPLTIVKFDQHTPRWGSTEQPERMAALSEVANQFFNAIQEADDVVVYVESDLIWEPATIIKAINIVAENDDAVDILGVMPFAGAMFYDVWAFRKNGERFHGLYPYHKEFNPEGLTEIDSAGSCLVMTGDVARQVRVRNGNAFVGWCEEARSYGYKIATHGQLSIRHPA